MKGKKLSVNKDVFLRKSELVVEAKYKLSDTAIKILSIIYSHVSDDEAKNDIEIILPASEYIKAIGKKNGKIHDVLKNAMNEIMGSTFMIEDKLNKKWKIFNWVTYAEYDSGMMKVKISKEIIPYVFQIKNSYLQYKLRNILDLKGSSSIRMYELLKHYANKNLTSDKNKASFEIDVEWIKDRLGLTSYNNFKDLRKRVIEPAIKQLKNTDIEVEYEFIKVGRKIKAIKFIVKNKDLTKLYDFVSIVREKYSGSTKAFAIKKIGGVTYFVSVDIKGRIFAFLGNEIIDLDKNESMDIYKKWCKIYNNYQKYKDMVDNGKSITEIFDNSKEWGEFLYNAQKILLS